jgi:uncharacterized membrane protein YebE (DUF533 family)
MVDLRNILDGILNDAKGLATKGKDMAADRLGGAGGDKDGLMKGLGAGAAGGALLGLLLGTKSGRKMGGGLVKLGSLAAVGTLAYRAYQRYQSDKGQGQAAAPATALEGPKADPLLLLRAMIAAANADGHIDDAEKRAIEQEIIKLNLGSEATAALQTEIAMPRSAEALAHGINDPAVATEVYALSASIIDDANADEAAYLARLARALKLDDALVQEITAQLKG